MNFDPISFAMGMNAAKGSGGSSGGGSVEDVHFVTFMSEDGTTELYKRPVADGDDCADPVKRGLMDEPEKESTAQYAYTHAGWSASPNGALDNNVLKAVTADKTVYANFAAVLRYYTITYYDSDGTTVLKTESLAYGSTPVYVAEKDGYSFTGWEPSLATVTGEASYVAQFEEKITFAGASWAKIAEISEAGEAANYFALGDTRIIPVTISGTTYSYTAKIVGFNHDKKSESGTVNGISIMLFTVPDEKYTWDADNTSGGTDYYWSDIQSVISNFYKYFPQELKSVIKYKYAPYNTPGTTKLSTMSQTFKTWCPSSVEISSKATSSASVGTLYEYFKNTYYGNTSNSKTKVTDTSGTVIESFWVRDSSTIDGNYRPQYLSQGSRSNTSATSSLNIAIGFCV